MVVCALNMISLRDILQCLVGYMVWGLDVDVHETKHSHGISLSSTLHSTPSWNSTIML